MKLVLVNCVNMCAFGNHLTIMIIGLIYHFIAPSHCATFPVNLPDGGKLTEHDEVRSYSYLAPEGPGTYSFGFDIEDADTENVQFRNEEKLRNGSVVGSYGYLAPTGDAVVVHYIADHLGYRATVEDSVKAAYLKPGFLPDRPYKYSFPQNQPKDIHQKYRPYIWQYLSRTNQNHPSLGSSRIVTPPGTQIVQQPDAIDPSWVGNRENNTPPPPPGHIENHFGSEEESNAFYYPSYLITNSQLKVK